MKGYTNKGGTPRCMMQLGLQKAYDMIDWQALESMLQEIGLPRQFIDWIMNVTSTISYRFNINGIFSDVLKDRRGIMQGDPISPMILIIIMEYMNISLTKMQKDHNFNHHAKCEKLSLINLTFADDVLLFSRGDQKSVEMMLDAFKKLYESTDLIVNPRKCKDYRGGIGEIQRDI